MPETQSTEDHTHPQLFMLRVWLEDLGDGRSEWRGRVQQVSSGDARYFRDWPTLVACLDRMLAKRDTGGAAGDDRDLVH